MYQRYTAKLGATPPYNEEFAGDQLTTLHHVVQHNNPPYVHTGVWGPYGHRLLRKVRMKGVRIMPDGRIEQVEMVGPMFF